MSSHDYMPAEDAQFMIWAQSFSDGISADCAKFMMTPAEAASIASTVTAFFDALLVASNEATRTKPTIIAKDDARNVCQALCRQYAMIIKDNTGISDEDKVAIGVRPINPNRESIDQPTTQPLVNVLGNTPGVQTLRYADSTTPDSRARPFGYASLQLFLGVTEDEPADAADCQFHGAFTKNPIEVDFTETQDGKMATYYARWANAKGEVGPFSVPVSFRIAA